MALALNGQNALKGGGRDPQPLGHGDVIFHSLSDGMSADHQHMGAAEQVTTHINAAFMLLGNRIVKIQGQVEGRADGRKARLIDRPAIPGRLFRIFTVAAIPRGGNISKGSFHIQKPPFFL